MPNDINEHSNPVDLGPELVRLAQARVRAHGVRLDNELARQIAEQAIIDLPEELELSLDESATMSQSDVLSGSVGVNDVVVNGRQIDVRPVSSEQTVAIDRALIGSPYLSQGSLVVRLDQNHPGRGSVVGYITPNFWLKAESAAQSSDLLTLQVELPAAFDLAKQLVEISHKPIIKLPSMSRISDVKGDVGELVNNRESLISSRQKQIFAYLSTNWTAETLGLVESIPVNLSPVKIQRVLADGAVWQGKIERLVDKLVLRFPELGKELIKKQVISAGERWGSQLGAPRYRRILLAELLTASVSAKNAKSPLISSLNRAQALMEKVLSGVSPAEAVKNVIPNQMAIDLALVIQKQRKTASISGFIAATAEELGVAYGQLALSPAYATHSAGEDSGLASVNEALVLIEAMRAAEGARSLEMDLANF